MTSTEPNNHHPQYTNDNINNDHNNSTSPQNNNNNNNNNNNHHDDDNNIVSGTSSQLSLVNLISEQTTTTTTVDHMDPVNHIVRTSFPATKTNEQQEIISTTIEANNNHHHHVAMNNSNNDSLITAANISMNDPTMTIPTTTTSTTTTTTINNNNNNNNNEPTTTSDVEQQNDHVKSWRRLWFSSSSSASSSSSSSNSSSSSSSQKRTKSSARRQSAALSVSNSTTTTNGAYTQNHTLNRPSISLLSDDASTATNMMMIPMATSTSFLNDPSHRLSGLPGNRNSSASMSNMINNNNNNNDSFGGWRRPWKKYQKNNKNNNSGNNDNATTAQQEQKRSNRYSKNGRHSAKVCGACLHRTFWSVSTVILVMLVLGVALTGLAIWITNFTVTKRGTNDVARRTELTITGGITDHIVSKGREATEILLNVLTQLQQAEKLGINLMDPSDRKGIISVFASFLQYSIINGLMVARDDTHVVTAVFKDINHSFLLSVSDESNPNLLSQYYLDQNSLNTYGPPRVVEDYNISSREWYTYPKKYHRPVWTPMYVSMAGGTYLSVAFSSSFLHQGGQGSGVAAVVLQVDQVSLFLKELVANSTNTRVMIITSKGYLIGVSIGEASTENATNIFEPIKAQNHSDPVVRETAQQVQRRYAQNSLINVGRFTTFQYDDSGGVTRLVAMSRLYQSPDNSWISIVVLREDDVTGAIDRANTITLAVSISVIILSILVALLIGCVITIPLKTVSKQMKRIANMDFEQEKQPMTLKLYEIDNMVSSMRQMQKALNNFTKYVPSTVVKELVRKNETVQLGVSPHIITVLYLDIKDFTSITEMLDAPLLIMILEEFFTEMSAILTEHHGIIDKYIGDCIMALFNVPHDVPQHQLQAVSAAIRIHKRLLELNSRWQVIGYPLIEIRVGINTDMCLVGNVGSSSRVSYTALGEGVTTASRFESLNKVYGTKTIIGQNTLNHVWDRCLCMWLSHVSFLGRPEPIHIYAVLCLMEEATPQQVTLCDLHNQAKQAYLAKDFPLMQQICLSILAIDTNDLAAQEWISRMNEPSFFDNIVLSLAEK